MNKLEPILEEINSLIIIERLTSNDLFICEIKNGIIYVTKLSDGDWKTHQFKVSFNNNCYHIHFFRHGYETAVHEYETVEEISRVIRKFFLKKMGR